MADEVIQIDRGYAIAAPKEVPAPIDFGDAPFQKYDKGKADLHLLPPDGLTDIAEVLMVGATKYDRENWRKMQPEDFHRVYSAALRHLFSYRLGKFTDEETGLRHIAHAACCLLFLVTLDRRTK